MIHFLRIATNYEDTLSELADCELDARNWGKLLRPWCTTNFALLGRRVTREGIMEAGRKWLDRLGPGGLGVLLYSGHGTREKIAGRWVEAIVCDDFELIYDFEMAELLGARNKKSTLVVLADCCHSGTMHRAAKAPRNVRSLPIGLCKSHRALPGGGTRALANVIYYAGCEDGEEKYSYSTGKGGAMSLAMQQAIRELGPDATFRAIFRRVAGKRPKGLLPTDQWPQSPQLRASTANARRTLQSFVA